MGDSDRTSHLEPVVATTGIVPPVVRARRVSCAYLALVLSLIAAPAFAQEPVNRWADGVSWGTAMVNPTLAVVDAIRAPNTKCKLGRLALSEAIGNGVTLTLKHFVVSPRPCLGCAADGFPSGHSMQSTIGASGWRFGATFAATTGGLRMQAHRHTGWQVAAGLAIGAGAEFAGRLIKCE